MNRSPPPRLHLMRAESVPVTAVIRRGPTRWFHVARWWHDDGRVEHGAWTRIKLYPNRCAISPDGRLLAVFALGGEWGPYFAVSRAPWLHAHAAWSTIGTWTSGAHFRSDGGLMLAGCGDERPFHGSYPGEVAREGVDMHWARGALFRELRTGWVEVPHRTEKEAGASVPAWIASLPAPLDASPGAVVAERPDPADPERALVVVSLVQNQREYYLREGERVVPLPALARADWARNGDILAASVTGHIQRLDRALRPVWEYDMGAVEPDPTPAPAEATRPL